MRSILIAALLLAATTVVLVPSASADMCASAVLENQVCGAATVFYCVEYGTTTKTLLTCEGGAVQEILTIPPQE